MVVIAVAMRFLCCDLQLFLLALVVLMATGGSRSVVIISLPFLTAPWCFLLSHCFVTAVVAVYIAAVNCCYCMLFLLIHALAYC